MEHPVPLDFASMWGTAGRGGPWGEEKDSFRHQQNKLQVGKKREGRVSDVKV